MKEIESLKSESKIRRKLLAGMGLLSILPLWKAMGISGKKKPVISCAVPDEIKTAKVLSQDGKLVEVDISKIKKVKDKISDQELRDWIKK